MILIMIVFKTNMTRNQITDSDSLMYEIKLKMSMSILAPIKKCFMLVTSRLYQNTVIIQVNQLLEK